MKSLDQLTRFYKGGGGGGQAAQQTITSAPPPPTTQSVEVQQAQRDANKAAAKRKGQNSTILAGETMGRAPLGSSTVLAGAGQNKATTLGGV